MAQTDFGRGVDDARCALHPERRATGPCERCGSFMCDLCSENDAQPLCPTCRQRTGRGSFPLRRDTWSFNALWDYCFEVFKREWVMLSLAALIVGGVSVGGQLLSRLLPTIGQLTESTALVVLLALVGFVLQTVIQGVITLGMLRLCFDVLEGRGMDIGRLFSQVHKAWRLLGATLITIVMVGVPFLLVFGAVSLIGMLVAGVPLGALDDGDAVFRSYGVHLVAVLIAAVLITLIPTLYISLPLYLLQAEIAFDDAGGSALRAIRNCYTLAQGERLSIFGVMLLVGLMVMIGLLACCVGALPAMGLGQLLVAGLYLALRRGSPLEARPR